MSSVITKREDFSSISSLLFNVVHRRPETLLSISLSSFMARSNMSTTGKYGINAQQPNSQSLTRVYSRLWHRVRTGPPAYVAPGGPVRQPYATVDYIRQSGTKNLAKGIWGRRGLTATLYRTWETPVYSMQWLDAPSLENFPHVFGSWKQENACVTFEIPPL